MKKYFFSNGSFYSPQWQAIGNVIGSDSPIDRTNTFDHGFDYSVYSPIPDLTVSSELTLTEAADARGYELAAMENPFLLWSGGIDSTMVLTSLLKTQKPFTVGYTHWSTIEYPALFDRMQNREWLQIELFELGSTSFAEIQAKHSLVTGVCGDQLIGTENLFNKQHGRPHPELLVSWQDMFHQSIVEFFEEQVSKAQIPIASLIDFLWWLNFSLKYQHVQFSFYSVMAYDVTQMDKVHHYFDDPGLQAWSMRNREEINEFAYSGVNLDYKKTFKQYINAVLDDENYLINKPKVRSVSDEIRQRTNLRLVDQNGKPMVEYF